MFTTKMLDGVRIGCSCGSPRFEDAEEMVEVDERSDSTYSVCCGHCGNGLFFDAKKNTITITNTEQEQR